MENKNIVIGVAVALVVVFGVSFLKPTSVTNVVNVPKQDVQQSGNLGAFSGPEVYSNLNVHGTFITNGGTALATTTTATTYTMVEKDLMPFSMIDVMENVGAATFTLPATSTMYALLGGNQLGATREWLFHNATSSSSITLTLAAGAGMDLIAVTANDDVIDPGEYTRLTCTLIPYRTADNENVVCIVDELGNAD